MSFLEQMRLEVADLVFPSNRFFTPTDRFWDWLAETVKTTRLIECGSGSGELLDDAADRKIHLQGCDLIRRENQSHRVSRLNACIIDWQSADASPLICRPSHDGWANTVIENARRAGRPSWIVGLPKNYAKDLSYYRTQVVETKVGMEGETLYAVWPILPRSPRK